MEKAMLITVGTGRSGKDIAGAICFSIERERPDHLTFFKTERSEETTMPHIRSHPVVDQVDVHEVLIHDEDDIQGICSQCEKVIRDLMEKGYQRENIVADFTSGTKAMSAGLSMAALNTRLSTLVYVSGERAKDGRVIPGTERSVTVRPNKIIAEALLAEAIKLFNRYQFDACIGALENAKALYQAEEFVGDCEVLQEMAEGYGRWDRFDLGGAFTTLQGVDEKSLPDKWKVGKKLKLNKQALYREKENLFCEERAVDLLENARRRGDTEKKYDDAVARLYRLCEYVAQLRLNQKNMYRLRDGKVDTSDLDLERLPEELEKKYSQYVSERDGKVKLPLYASFELLADLNDEIGKDFLQDESLSKKLLQVRNNSILAHGLSPISHDTYSEMKRCIERLIERNFGNVNRLRSRIRFPAIGLP